MDCLRYITLLLIGITNICVFFKLSSGAHCVLHTQAHHILEENDGRVLHDGVSIKTKPPTASWRRKMEIPATLFPSTDFVFGICGEGYN